MLVADCYACGRNADAAAPLRDRIVRTDSWRVMHVTETSLPGWLVLVPMTHIESLDQLSEAAAAELGPLLRRLTRALIAVTGCVKTYVLLVAEKPGFAHLHFHIVPRAAAMADEQMGPGVFALLGVSADEQVPLADQDRLAAALRTALAVPD